MSNQAGKEEAEKIILKEGSDYTFEHTFKDVFKYENDAILYRKLMYPLKIELDASSLAGKIAKINNKPIKLHITSVKN